MKDQDNTQSLRPLEAPDEEYGVKAGDILLFKPNYTNRVFSLKKGGLGGKAITMGQAFASLSFIHNTKGGHSDTVHAAICVGQNEQGKPMIAHFHEKIGTYCVVPLEDQFINQNTGKESNRSFMTFTPKNEQQGKKIVEEALNDRYKGVKYNFRRAARSVFKWNTKKQNETEQKTINPAKAEAMFCSRFAIEVLKNIGKNIGLINNSSPRALESALRRDKGFSMKNNLGIGGAKDIEDVINKQITRLGKIAPEKGFQAKIALGVAKALIAALPNATEEQKAKIMLEKLGPVFNRKRSALSTIFRRAPKSFEELKFAAIRKGFSSSDLKPKEEVGISYTKVPTITPVTENGKSNQRNR